MGQRTVLNDVLLLGHRFRRRPNIKTTLGEHFFAWLYTTLLTLALPGPYSKLNPCVARVVFKRPEAGFKPNKPNKIQIKMKKKCVWKLFTL